MDGALIVTVFGGQGKALPLPDSEIGSGFELGLRKGT